MALTLRRPGASALAMACAILAACCCVETMAQKPRPPDGGGAAPPAGGDAAGGGTQCATDGSDYAYSETISGQERIITITYCPNGPFSNLNPNFPVNGGSTTYTVPAYPKLESDTTITADLNDQGGSVGVFFNGAMLFSPYGGGQYGYVTSYENSAAFAEGDSFDACGCHGSSTTSASYHCHVPPSCLIRQLGGTPDDTAHSPQIGWAADGFPVYGPLGLNGISMKTCSVSGGSMAAGECTNDNGGLPIALPSVDSYTMRYYTMGPTHDGTSCENPLNPLPGAEYHPSTPTGFMGCCPSGVSCSGSQFLPTCSGSASSGYTDSFAAAAWDKALGIDCGACWASSELGAANPLCTGNGDESSPTDPSTPADTAASSPPPPPPFPPPPVGDTAPSSGDTSSSLPQVQIPVQETLTDPKTGSVRTGVSTVSVELELNAAQLIGPSATVTSRVYNGMMPGPTWRVKRGDVVTVKLTNALGPETATYQLNEFGHVNTTNIHTHGLHIDSNTGSDDIFKHIGPGEVFTYTYKIDESHMPGTHWFHPHVHGSTALQAGAGAFGVIIVEDVPGMLPAAVESMPEKLLAFNHMNTMDLQAVAQQAGDELYSVSITNAVTTETDLVFVNGHYQPKVELAAGTWTRLRMVLASVQQQLHITVAGCELQLIAKDGVYLTNAPRAITTIQLAPGNRADVAVMCPTAGSYEITSAANGRRRSLLQPGGGGGGGGPGGPRGGGDVFEGVLGTVEVTGTSSSSAPLPEFSVDRPCYLVDLQNVNGADLETGFSLRLGPPPNINGAQFSSSTTYITSMEVGKVHQWDVTGVDGHPLHIHVNPFQITSKENAGDGYFQVGDWHDVLMPDTGGDATIRFQTNAHTGKVVIHCHILEHEDEGMMAVAQITGTEGTIWGGSTGCTRHGYYWTASSPEGVLSLEITSPPDTPPASPPETPEVLEVAEDEEVLAVEARVAIPGIVSVEDFTEALRSQFRADAAKAANVAVKQVKIIRVIAGSVLVDSWIMFPVDADEEAEAFVESMNDGETFLNENDFGETTVAIVEEVQTLSNIDAAPVDAAPPPDEDDSAGRHSSAALSCFSALAFAALAAGIH